MSQIFATITLACFFYTTMWLIMGSRKARRFERYPTWVSKLGYGVSVATLVFFGLTIVASIIEALANGNGF